MRWWKKVVTIPSPHVKWPPQSLEDEAEALKVVRDYDHERSKSLINEFQWLFLDSLDNQVKHACCFASLFESLYWLCSILDIGKWDEIICINTVWWYLDQVGALLWCAVHWTTQDSYESLITEQTRMIVILHPRGMPVDVSWIKETLPEWIILVEDCMYAQWVLSKWKPAWTIADVWIFPLQYSSLVFTGQWAILVTNDTLLYDCLKWRKKNDTRSVEYIGEYWMSVLSPFHTTIGKYSLRHRNRIMKGSERCAVYLKERLSSVSFLELIESEIIHPWDRICYRYRFKCWYDPEKLRKLSVDGVVNLLQSEWVLVEKVNELGAIHEWKYLLSLPAFYDWYRHKDVIDQYIAAFRKVQINLFC